LSTEGPIDDPSWTVREVTLEDLILAYLADGDTQASHTEWGVPA
jgi:ABC-2 type transport system ATP-binding protein